MAMAAGAALWTSLPSTSSTLGAPASSFPSPRGVKRLVTKKAPTLPGSSHIVIGASSTGGGAGRSFCRQVLTQEFAWDTTRWC